MTINGKDVRTPAARARGAVPVATAAKPTLRSSETSITWTREQEQALKLADRWFKDKKSKQVFRLDGYAGTGKTRLARRFREDISGLVLYAAYTGKAVLGLRKNGITDVSTLHSLLYKSFVKDGGTLSEFEKELVALEAKKAELISAEISADDLNARRREILALQRQIRARIKAEKAEVGQLRFKLNPESALKKARLLIVDEHSMIDRRLGLDILSAGCKVLLLGDPFQLPPPKSNEEGFFMEGEPDYLLEEVHRQAADSPVLHLATRVRRGMPLELGTYGESSVTSEVDSMAALEASQIIVGKNSTRLSCNGRVRQLRHWDRLAQNLPEGLTSIEQWPTKERPPVPKHPIVGDKIICLDNDHELGLLNGEIYEVEKLLQGPPDEEAEDLGFNEGTTFNAPSYTPFDPVYMKIRAQERDLSLHVEAVYGAFNCEKFEARTPYNRFDFGYAITTHKAQGSEWDDVLIFDESAVFRKNRHRWLYTAITRARNKVKVLKIVPRPGMVYR